jgi:signal transduction histidine kinase
MLKLGPSLFRRTLLAQALVVFVFLVLNYAVILLNFYTDDGGVIDKDLKLVAEATARAASIKPDTEGARRAAEDIEEMNRARSTPEIAKSEYAWQVWHRDGRLIARSQDSPSLPDLPPGSISHQKRDDRNGWILIAADSPHGDVTAVVGYSRTMLERVFWRVVRASVPNIALILSLIGFAFWLASLFGLRPLFKLSKEIAARTPEQEQDVAMPRHRELVTIVSAMNHLLAQARARRQQERAFFADAAHELRAPLAVINAQAYALAASGSPDERQDALRVLEHGVDRSADVLDKFLALARLDRIDAADDVSTTTLNVCALVRAVLAEQAPRALASGHDLGASAGTAAWALAEQFSLRMALDNLVDNALRYTDSGSRIEVSVIEQGDRVLILVEDDGPGIAAAEHEQVFRRFERGSHRRQQAGSGLGLAIVTAAMQRCHGKVTLSTSPAMGGALFTLELQAGSAPASPEPA